MENEPHAVRYKIWKQLTKPIKKKKKKTVEVRV